MSSPAVQQEAADLAVRIRTGDAVAEEKLYERYRRGLAMILGRMLGSEGEAEDLLQETFRLAIEKLRRGELREATKLPQFLNSLARNLAIDHFRREGRRKTDVGLEGHEVELLDEPGQLRQTLRRQKAALAMRVLRELPTPRDREILYRFYIAEADKAEICRDLGLSSLHFNRVLHRARQRYRQLYEEHAGKV